MLLLLYENIFFEITSSDSQKLSYRTVICKDNTKHYDVKFFRTFGLLNIDINILSKIKCTRMGLLSDKRIGKDQTCEFYFRQCSFPPKFCRLC